MITKLAIVLSVVTLVKLCNGLPTFWQKNTPQNIHKLWLLRPDELAEEHSGQFEGDMVLSPKRKKELFNGLKTGLIDEKYRWINNTIPYEVNITAFNTEQLKQIDLGLRTLENVTCLKFVPRKPEHNDYIYVTGTATGCWSEVGKIGGKQELNLKPSSIGTGCFRLGTVMHEFIHAIGFYHMQSASDRDTYVNIVWENIGAGKENNFKAYTATQISNYSVAYDYESVMHYSATAFSKNGEKTIVPIKDPNANIGQRTKLTAEDIQRIKNKYCV